MGTGNAPARQSATRAARAGTGLTYRLLPGWRAGDTVILPALRTLYAYTAREPGRATGWLWLPGGHPVTPWPHVLATLGPQLLADLERDTGITFAACAFQAYLDGAGTGWHHDRDWDAQAILSLGVTRTFGLRRGGREQFLRLAHGDLLVMPPGFQDDGWEHGVPAEEVEGERCSLVFRSRKIRSQLHGDQRHLHLRFGPRDHLVDVPVADPGPADRQH
jgi:hypothetical protein